MTGWQAARIGCLTLILVVVVILALQACGRSSSSPSVRALVRPVTVLNVDCDSKCGGLFDVCLRVNCDVYNDSGSVRNATVSARATRSNGSPMTRSESVRLAPRERRTVSLTMEAATVDDRNVRCSCSVD
jgi:hypothetical protein